MVETMLEGGLLETLQPAAETVSSDESRNAETVRQYRNRLSEIDDAMWDDLCRRMQAGESNRSLARLIHEAGLCARLAPKSLEIYLGHIRAALGIPVSTHETSEQKNQADRPIEAHDALSQLRWLRRVQEGRIEQAILLEGRMGGLLMPPTDRQIALLADLIVKELKFLSKPGELKASLMEEVATQQGSEFQFHLSPAEAMQVVSFIDRALRAARQKGEAEDNISCDLEVGDPSDPAETAGVSGTIAEAEGTEAGAGPRPVG